jgi:hypothetical protein
MPMSRPKQTLSQSRHELSRGANNQRIRHDRDSARHRTDAANADPLEIAVGFLWSLFHVIPKESAENKPYHAENISHRALELEVLDTFG